MKKNVTIQIFLIPAIILFTAAAFALGHSPEKGMKKGIVLVAFDSSIPEVQVSFENIEKDVKKEFERIPVRRAYTSVIIRKKMKKQGNILDSAAMALAKMKDDGFIHVAVQSSADDF